MSKEVLNSAGSEHAVKKKLDLVITSLVGKWQHSFDPERTVHFVIEAAINHFKPKLEDGNYQLERKSTKEVMEPGRTLESYHTHDKEELLLVPCDDGGGQ